MREMLFKAKRTDNEEWVEGYLVISNDILNQGKAYILPCISDFFFSYGDNGKRIRIGCFVEVDPETVCQYTGLKDKNGIKVFDGDIVSVKDREEIYKFVVCFGKSGGIRNVAHDVGYIGFYFEGFSKETKNLQKFGLRDDIVYWLEEYDCEVIGNIHDKEGEHD